MAAIELQERPGIELEPAHGELVSLRSFRVDEVEQPDRRRDYLANLTGVDLTAVGENDEHLVGTENNINNPFGTVTVPLGAAGPVLVRGEYADGLHYVPYATTEGALVASTSRGAKALTEAGGVLTRVDYRGMTRGPILRSESDTICSFSLS